MSDWMRDESVQLVDGIYVMFAICWSSRHRRVKVGRATNHGHLWHRPINSGPNTPLIFNWWSVFILFSLFSSFRRLSFPWWMDPLIIDRFPTNHAQTFWSISRWLQRSNASKSIQHRMPTRKITRSRTISSSETVLVMTLCLWIHLQQSCSVTSVPRCVSMSIYVSFVINRRTDFTTSSSLHHRTIHCIIVKGHNNSVEITLYSILARAPLYVQTSSSFL